MLLQQLDTAWNENTSSELAVECMAVNQKNTWIVWFHSKRSVGSSDVTSVSTCLTHLLCSLQRSYVQWAYIPASSAAVGTKLSSDDSDIMGSSLCRERPSPLRFDTDEEPFPAIYP